MKTNIELTIIGILIFAATAIGFTSGVMQNKNTVKKCNEVRAYIPVKGKWLEKNVCLEGEK